MENNAWPSRIWHGVRRLVSMWSWENIIWLTPLNGVRRLGYAVVRLRDSAPTGPHHGVALRRSRVWHGVHGVAEFEDVIRVGAKPYIKLSLIRLRHTLVSRPQVFNVVTLWKVLKPVNTAPQKVKVLYKFSRINIFASRVASDTWNPV